MSENLDLVRSIYAAWEQGNFRVTSWADPQLHVVNADGPAPGTRLGLRESMSAWREFLTDWDERGTWEPSSASCAAHSPAVPTATALRRGGLSLTRERAATPAAMLSASLF
jgi:hypothetical protein